MARMQAEIRSYFATPVVIATLPDAAELNAELRRIILQHERQHQSVQHSNLGGWQSSWDFEEWGETPARRLLDAARELATRMTSDRNGKPVRIPWKTNAWANVNRRSHGNEFHTHPGAYWSGTYYVDDGGIGDDPSLGGAFAVPGGQSAGASELICPKSGQLVLFPSWLLHAVRPYRGERERISVAFNFGL
jgi:uncharacterized protein (TIGR02466 family)